WTRTSNPSINSRMLCQLSYRGLLGLRSRISHPLDGSCAVRFDARPPIHRGDAAMKIPFLVGAAVGYVLGSRAGRERYEQIVRIARKTAGSQTVQSTAGVLQAQLDGLADRARIALADRLP